MDQYRQFRFRIQSFGLDDGTSCPPCHGNPQGKKVVSIDGNFGLVRKKSSGVSPAPPNHTMYFADQAVVDQYLKNNTEKDGAANRIRECNDFQAGSALRAKGKSANLDEKGVMGSACRHEIPLRFCSLKHGERFLYPAFLLRELVKLPQMKDSTSITLVYDVACQLEGHLQKYHCDLPLGQLQLAIPVFHAYGHKLFCQATKSLRSTPGVGLVDGEAMERMWSYLRCFGPMTKEMKPSKRVDLLTDALIHFARKQRQRLGQAFCLRRMRADKGRAEADHEIATLLGGDSVADETISEWASEDAASLRNAPSVAKMAASEEYVLKLSSFYSEQAAADENGQDNEEAVMRLEKSMVLFEKNGAWDLLNSQPSCRTLSKNGGQCCWTR